MQHSEDTIPSTEPHFRWLILTVVIAAFSLAVTVVAPAAFAKDNGHEGADLGPGCAPDRPAIAHHAGGVIANTDKDEKAPIPCSTATGYRTSEISLVVTNAGTLLFEPALANETPGLPIGVLRSVSRGESWDFVNPTVTPSRLSSVDMNMWVDRDTGRVFWSSDGVGLSAFGIEGRSGSVYMDLSDDDGKTWVRSSPLPMFYDHTQVFTGPPTNSRKHLMEGYPNVVYVAVAGGFTCIVFNFCQTHVAKSLDGGMTFSEPVALPYPPDCPAPGTLPTGGYGLNGVVSRDGTVYLPFTPCEQPYVAISHDGGNTWQLSLVADTETIGWGELSLGMDKHENLYTAWTSFVDRLPYLSISRDHGLHWSTPLMIGAPGVNEAAEPLLIAGARGQVAVAYYGSTDAPLPFPTGCAGFSLGCSGYQNETWDTYVTETFNALDHQPLFWSATLNDPAYPTWYGATPSSFRVDETAFEGGNTALAGFGGPSQSGRMDYYAATMAPDGTAWVGFTQECPDGQPVAGNPNCPSTLTGAPTDGLFGLVGRLVRRNGHDHADTHGRDH